MCHGKCLRTMFFIKKKCLHLWHWVGLPPISPLVSVVLVMWLVLSCVVTSSGVCDASVGLGMANLIMFYVCGLMSLLVGASQHRQGNVATIRSS